MIWHSKYVVSWLKITSNIFSRYLAIQYNTICTQYSNDTGKNRPDFEPKKDISYLAFAGDLWGVIVDLFGSIQVYLCKAEFYGAFVVNLIRFFNKRSKGWIIRPLNGFVTSQWWFDILYLTSKISMVIHHQLRKLANFPLTAEALPGRSTAIETRLLPPKVS